MTHDAAWLPPKLEPVAMRLARVDQVIFELGQICLEWSKSGLEVREVEDGGVIELVVTQVRPIPPLVPLLFSEAIHQLRSALENTVFYLAEAERGTPIAGRQAVLVEMPVKTTAESFGSWQARRVKEGVPELGPATSIGQRINALQPYIDTTALIPSVSPAFNGQMGPTESEHALVLLQQYSNTDKHRAIRLAAARTMVRRADGGYFGEEKGMQPIAPGDVVASTSPGVGVEVDLSTAVHVQRPDSEVWVPPATELHRLYDYVSKTAIPTLILGLGLSRSLPPEIDLGDSGQTYSERIHDGGWTPAHTRILAPIAEVMMNLPPRQIPPR